MDRIKALIAWAQATRPARVFARYGTDQGPILASGLAFQGIFAIFAAIWVGFSVLGLVLGHDDQLRTSIINQLSVTVPGLVSNGSGAGVIKPSQLLQTSAVTITGLIALVGLLVTALGWLSSARSAIRSIFGLRAITGNPVLLKLKDLGVAIGFGIVLIVSTVLSVVGSAATDFVLGLIGLGAHSVAAVVFGRILTIALAFAIDAVTLGALFRVLSGVSIPWARMRGGVLLGAAGLGVLKVAGSSLLGGASKNPLLASFAVILGLLIFFTFVCQVILIAAAWIAVGLDDRGVRIDGGLHAAQVTEAKALLEAEGLAVGVPIRRRGSRTRIRR